MVVETIQIETLRNHAPGAFSFRLPSETSTLWAHFSLFAGFFLDRVCQEKKSPRNQIDQISYHELQAVREAVCEGCKGNVWFDDSDCRYVCPDFLAAVDEHLQEARP